MTYCWLLGVCQNRKSNQSTEWAPMASWWFFPMLKPCS